MKNSYRQQLKDVRAELFTVEEIRRPGSRLRQSRSRSSAEKGISQKKNFSGVSQTGYRSMGTGKNILTNTVLKVLASLGKTSLPSHWNKNRSKRNQKELLMENNIEPPSRFTAFRELSGCVLRWMPTITSHIFWVWSLQVFALSRCSFRGRDHGGEDRKLGRGTGSLS